LLNPLVDHTGSDSCRRVTYPTVLNYSDVELHDVAVLNPTLTRDSMDNFVVDRDANVARENAVPKPITKESAFHFRPLHEVSRRFVHLFRCDSGPDQLAHSIENLARGAARSPHFVHFLRALDWNHQLLRFD